MAAPVTLAQYTAAWCLMPIAYGLLLVMPSIMLPGDNLGVRGFQTPPLGPNLRLGQTFLMTVDGLRAIEIFPVPVGGRLRGDVLFELYEIDAAGYGRRVSRVRSQEVAVEELLTGLSYRFEFAPILDSRDRTYRLDLVASPAEGVAFWATKGDRYRGGRMHANSRERWADLAFRVHASTPSIWGRLRALHERSAVRAYVVATALVGLAVLLPVGLRALTGLASESGSVRHDH